jgi:dihydrolipoamide dehydrogenase
VVATGSRPIDLPGLPFDGQRVIDSSRALSLAEVPRRLAVIGGGYIGLELGFMYRKLGTEVTVVEMLDQVLPGFDDDLAKAVARSLKKKGIETLLASKATGLEKIDGGVRLTVQTPDGARSVECDHVLVTVGRRPNSGGLGLEGCGVAIDAKGFVTVDEQRRTNVPGVWAIGDVAGQPMLAHKAYREAEVAAECIAGHSAAFDVRAIPAVCFTDPEVAVVGLSEREAAQQGRKVKVGKVPFGAVSRAVTNHDVEGYVKVLIDESTREILGAAAVGHEASELIAEAGLAIEMAGFAEDVALTIHAHPTLAEAIKEAAAAAIGEAIHVLNR